MNGRLPLAPGIARDWQNCANNNARELPQKNAADPKAGGVTF
jgi:hypothetical protein